ncbi:MAG TPA: catalase family peroxidase [Pyrinomonadaceae bacterium]
MIENKSLIFIGFFLCTIFAAPVVISAQQTPTTSNSEPKDVTAKEVTDALEGAYGVHKGQRRNHTKGVCALGTFTGLKSGAPYSRSALFSGQPIEVVARFSIAGGDPTVPDTDRGPRGMALEFRLPNGALQHMTMINTPMFFAAMPRTFLDKMLALKPDPKTGKPDPAAFKAFMESHPDNMGQANFLAFNNPPVSYTNESYFGIHTFKFINKDNKITMVRWRFVPQDGERRLSDAELKTRPVNFLEQQLFERMKRGAARWDMLITIGEPGDSADDPTILWSKQRKELKVGTLSITSATPQPAGGCEKINYDPLVIADGIAATNDPVLLFRSLSYGFSFSRRLEDK